MSITLRLFILVTTLLPFLGCSSSTSPIEDSDRLYWAKIEVPDAPTSPLDGASTYQMHCASCHGDTGRGDGPNVASLTIPPRDFSLTMFKLRSTRGFPTDADLYRSISVGFPAYGMPAFDTLTPEERWGLVEHVKTLIQQAAPNRSITPGTPIVMPDALPYKQSSGQSHQSAQF